MAEASKGIVYAEETLGVHKVFEAAQHAADSVDRHEERLAGLRHEKRNLESAIADREVELLLDERGKHPEISATAMESRMKVIKNTDGDLRSIREKVSDLMAEIDVVEAMKSRAEIDVKIAVSRLQELGGYFAYLAAIKNHQAHDANDTKENPA